MGVNVRGRSFLTLLDYTPDEIRYLLDLSVEFKNMKRNGVDHSWLKGRQVVLLFEKTSTRTRCAFEVGARDLGMGVTFLDSGSSQMGKKESLEDTAKVLGRMFDGIEYRGFDQEVVKDLAKYSGVPVWNGLTDDFHPTQMLADIMTVQEEFGDWGHQGGNHQAKSIRADTRTAGFTGHRLHFSRLRCDASCKKCSVTWLPGYFIHLFSLNDLHLSPPWRSAPASRRPK